MLFSGSHILTQLIFQKDMEKLMISFKHLDPAMPEARHPWNCFLHDPINSLVLKPVGVGFLSLGTERALTNAPASGHSLSFYHSLPRHCSHGGTPINCLMPVTSAQVSTVVLGPCRPYQGRGAARFPTHPKWEGGCVGAYAHPCSRKVLRGIAWPPNRPHY